MTNAVARREDKVWLSRDSRLTLIPVSAVNCGKTSFKAYSKGSPTDKSCRVLFSQSAACAVVLPAIPTRTEDVRTTSAVEAAIDLRRSSPSLVRLSPIFISPPINGAETICYALGTQTYSGCRYKRITHEFAIFC